MKETVQTRLASLSEVDVAVLDCDHRTPTRGTRGYPYIAIPDLVDGRVEPSDSARISRDDYLEWTRRLKPQAGDIIVTRRGRVGDTAAIPAGLECAIGQNLVLLRSSGAIVDQRYLRWAARSPQWFAEVDRLRNVGAVFSSLNVRDIMRIEIPVPSLEEQRGIAEVLGAIDDKIAANNRLAETAQDLAHSMFMAAASGVPVVPMSELLTPILGGTPSRSNSAHWGGHNLWASARDITVARNGVLIDTAERITDHAISSEKTKPLPRGSVILTARGTVGRVARLAEAASINQSCYGFAPGAISPAVLYFGVLQAAENAKAMAHGSVFDTITMRTFDHLTLPKFSAAEHVDVEERLTSLLNVVEAQARESARLSETRDALLSPLMSGRLRVRDAVRVIDGAV